MRSPVLYRGPNRSFFRPSASPWQHTRSQPRDFDFDYKVIVTHKTKSVKNVVLFYNGRRSQEGIFGDAKNDAALNVVPSKRLAGNQLSTFKFAIVI